MASKKTLVRNLFNISKAYSRISGLTRTRPAKYGITTDAGESGIRRRFLHKRAFFSPEIVPAGGSLVEKLRELSLSNSRIRLDEMLPPKPPAMTSPENFPAVTVQDVKKLMRAAEMEMVKSRLREIGKNWVPYSEFVRVCGEYNSDPEEGNRVAKLLDETGNVIVLGNFVCLKPEELTSMVAGLIPTHEHTRDAAATRQEFEQLEIVKSDIDKRADDLVRRELWAGLGLFAAQIFGCFRLTFWELSWDVMEPICYFMTSTYFMAGYAFFLRTSKNPCFEGLYKNRFETKQKQLIQMLEFDIDRFNKLQKIHRPDLTKSAHH